MLKSLLLIIVLLFVTMPLTAQVTNKSYDPIPEPPFSYAKEEMDSIFQIAEGYFYRGNYEKVIEKVPALLEYAHKVKANRAETRFKGILGLSLVQLNDISRADEMLREALTDAMQRKDTFDILSNNINLANTHLNSNSEKSIYYFENAIDYLGDLDISVLAFVIIHNDLAELYMTRNEPRIAQQYLDLARPKLFLPELASRKTEYLASCDYIQAGIFLSQGFNFRAIESANQS
jgi:tetratricopeptide (TPR) repeat protein